LVNTKLLQCEITRAFFSCRGHAGDYGSLTLRRRMCMYRKLEQILRNHLRGPVKINHLKIGAAPIPHLALVGDHTAFRHNPARQSRASIYLEEVLVPFGHATSWLNEIIRHG